MPRVAEAAPPKGTPEYYDRVFAQVREVMRKNPHHTFSFDPGTGKVELLRRFAPRSVARPRRAPDVVRIQTSARTPRRRNVRRAPARARAPDDPLPEPEPPLRVVPLAASRSELEKAGL